jgi:hypothetical protein
MNFILIRRKGFVIIMNIVIWSFALGIPLMIVFLLLFGLTRKYSRSNWNIIAKCGGSYIAVITSLFVILSDGKNPLLSFIFWGLLLCCIADALLEIIFPVGTVVFGCAQVLFLAGFISVGTPPWWFYAIWVLLYTVVILINLKQFLSIKEGRILFFIYPALLLAGVSAAVTLPIRFGVYYIPAAIGMILFAISDSLVAKSQSKKGGNIDGALIMITYYAAIYLLAICS